MKTLRHRRKGPIDKGENKMTKAGALALGSNPTL